MMLMTMILDADEGDLWKKCSAEEEKKTMFKATEESMQNKKKKAVKDVEWKKSILCSLNGIFFFATKQLLWFDDAVWWRNHWDES